MNRKVDDKPLLYFRLNLAKKFWFSNPTKMVRIMAEKFDKI